MKVLKVRSNEYDTKIKRQNIFCELDKYCRQAIPDLKSNRTKIKKHYIPKKDKIEYIYPPKWELNT